MTLFIFHILYPGFGPLLVTTDADIFKDSINKLSASGGGDIPELCLSGLQVSTKVFLLLSSWNPLLVY